MNRCHFQKKKGKIKCDGLHTVPEGMTGGKKKLKSSIVTNSGQLANGRTMTEEKMQGNKERGEERNVA